ncbi:MAG: glutathione S-transferase family protein [Acetobacteraceae bacterium]|nr:glutathione S-transferase family protein [Acetobacteraceae bacterium]
MITVYGRPPSRSMRVIWMLEEMGLPYEVRPIDFAKRHEDKEFLDASPTGSFPGLRDGEVRMMESCAILEYLAAKYGPTRLAPALVDPAYPAYLSFLHFGEASLTGPLNIALATRFFAPQDEKDNWGARTAIDIFVRKSAAIAAQLKRHPFVAGDEFTAADISCGYAAGFGRFLGIEDRLDPAIPDYYRRLTERPAFQRAIQHTQMPA